MTTSTFKYADALRACAHADTNAFLQLSQEEAPHMLAVASSFLDDHHQAEDVVHDTLLLIWKNAHRYASSKHEGRDWIYTVLNSRLTNQLKALHQAAPSASTACLPRAGKCLELGERLPAMPLTQHFLARLKSSQSYFMPGSQMLKTANGEDIYPPLYDRRLRQAMLRARLQYIVRESFKSRIGRPLEEHLFKRWLNQAPRSHRIETLGLPRRSVEAYLNGALDIQIDPNQLIRSISFPDKTERRKLANQFIWRGDWDQRRPDVRTGSRYVFISDIWQHRLDLTQSDAYRRLKQRLQAGHPYRSHHKGILLDTTDRILMYLGLYLFYMEDMACFGFDASQGKDRLGVAIDRHGRIVKTHKGLHRLAMAQVLDLEQITVRVSAVHQAWWQRQTQGSQGRPALARMVHALPACQPAE